MSLDLDSLLDASGRDVAGLATFASAELDLKAGALDQLTLTVLESDARGWERLRAVGLLSAGASLRWRDCVLGVASVGLEWGRQQMARTLVARSALAGAMKDSYRTSVEVNTSPSAWVTRRAIELGGSAVCQPSATRERVVQMGGTKRQSDLDVVETLASQLGWGWAESGAVLRFGHRYWAWEYPAALHTVTWGLAAKTDAHDAQLDMDADDLTNSATGVLTLPYQVGAEVRPWDALTLDGFEDFEGTWLVDRVQITADWASPVTVHISQPRPPSARAGSSH